MIRYAKGKVNIAFHPLVAFFCGFLISLVLWPFLSGFLETFTDQFLALCVSMALSLFMGGFTATALSRSKKALIWIFEGISFAIVLIIIGFAGHQITFEYSTLKFISTTLVLCLLSAGAGGFEAIKSRNNFNQKKEEYEEPNISDNEEHVDKGYLVCDKCHEYYKLQPGESPDDFHDECECGGKLQYSEDIG